MISLLSPPTTIFALSLSLHFHYLCTFTIFADPPRRFHSRPPYPWRPICADGGSSRRCGLRPHGGARKGARSRRGGPLCPPAVATSRRVKGRCRLRHMQGRIIIRPYRLRQDARFCRGGPPCPPAVAVEPATHGGPETRPTHVLHPIRTSAGTATAAQRPDGTTPHGASAHPQMRTPRKEYHRHAESASSDTDPGGRASHLRTLPPPNGQPS